ncbi:MAG TPA: hypothetical protein VGI10_08860 [Polyangiaceae bacterium]
MPRRKPLVRQLAEESAKHVLSESTRAAIDKMAEDFAKEALADPEFRAYMRREVTAAVRVVIEAMREFDPELHGSGKP